MESDAIEHGKALLAGVARGPHDALERAQLHLTAEHFADAQQRFLWELITSHYGHTGAILTRETLSAVLRGETASTVMFYESYWDALLKRPAEPSAVLSWHVTELLDIAAERRTGEALARGMDILRRGVQEEGNLVKGHAEARAAVTAAMAEIDRSAALNGHAPEGDMRAEQKEMLEDYLRRRDLASTQKHLIPTGLASLDRLLGGGWQNGELNLIAGYTGSGKTSFCVQCAWYCSVVLGRNVVILTSETLRPQIRIKIIARHSVLSTDPERRRAYPGGLNSSLIKSGQLDAIGQDYYAATVRNLTENQFGKIWVAQIPKGSTVSSIETHLNRLSREFLADLVIVDYLQLLRADRKRQSKREELADIMQVAKEVAAGYADGRGVPMLSPWQMSRDGFTKAQARDMNGGYYTVTDLAETNEAGATADCVFTLLAPEMPGDKRRAVIRSRLAKNRDGDTSAVIELDADYATCLFTEKLGEARETGPSSPFDQALNRNG